ncbi:energy-coupled thiamine transporter ThiT [Spiroplasma endosymbiont of Amphibalanus improvisus]|uniref:energy-coupled thiamine transporter ThiT n=1 Tax=Spiroplasma endosymbiont of Amphibalanus improvisus TaxID=3066327 RepID=UPI00313DCBE8
MKLFFQNKFLYKSAKKPRVPWFSILGALSSILWIIAGLSFLITFSVLSSEQVVIFLNIHTTADNYSSIKMVAIVYLFLIILLSTLSLLFFLFDKDKNLKNFKVQFLIINIISFNILNIIMTIWLAFKNKDLENFEYTKKYKKNRFLYFLGWRKWKTFDIALVGIFVSLTVILAYVDGILPNLPNGGGIALKYIPLMVISFLHSFLAGFFTGLISSLIGILFVNSSIVSGWSFLLDYLLPMVTPAIVGLMKFDVTKDRDVKTYINYFLHTFLVLLIILFWQTLSGVLIWNQLYPDDVWQGYSPIYYSLTYNFLHLFIFSYPIIQVVTPIAYRSLSTVYNDKFSHFSITY